jgi:hypothetical protein
LNLKNYKIKKYQNFKNIPQITLNPSIIAVQCDSQKILKPNADRSRHVRVSLLKSIRKSLNFHAQHNELVNGNLASALGIIHHDQKVHKLLAEPEAHLLQCRKQLGLLNGATRVAVKVLEARQPRVDVVEEPLKLEDIDGAGAVAVKHRDHKVAGRVRELLALTRDESLLQLLGVNFAAAILVDLVEEILDL